jgi:hypothetical protein
MYADGFSTLEGNSLGFYIHQLQLVWGVEGKCLRLQRCGSRDDAQRYTNK